MERREARGVCEAPHGARHFLRTPTQPCLNGFCESPFGRACEARPEARAGDDLKACEALPPSRCASPRPTRFRELLCENPRGAGLISGLAFRPARRPVRLMRASRAAGKSANP